MLNNFFILGIFQLIITFPIIKLAKQLNFVDMPSKRKIHKTPTPYIGGIILAGSFLLIVLITDLNNVFLNSILSYSVLIAVAGFVDDKYSVNPGTKILLQIIPIFLLAEQGLILKDIEIIIILV